MTYFYARTAGNCAEGDQYMRARKTLFIVVAPCAPVPAEPDYCGNLVKDEDESGIDCGGPCPPCSISPSDHPRDSCLNVSISPH